MARRLGKGTACAVACSLLGLGGAAHAQQATTPEPGESRSAASLDIVTVTGTRIKQTEDYVSPNPISTFSSDAMQNLGLVNVADAITQIPSNVSTFQPTNTGGGAFFVGSTLANLRGLNPFFGTRTLTLVDSRRFVPTNQGGSVDLNFIPSVLIDRMEVVTGGASAAYGSEAVSGVVNILLNHNLQGIKMEGDYGASTHNDGANYHFGVAAGTSLFEDRGHLVIGGEFQKQEAIKDCRGARDWCARGRGVFSNGTGGGFFDPVPSPHPYTQTIPGQPQNIIASNLRTNQGGKNGVIFNNTPGATTTFQANAAGTGTEIFNLGANGHTGPAGLNGVVGGDGRPIYDGIGLIPRDERKTVYSHLSFDLTDSLRGYVEASYGQVEALNRQFDPFQNTVNSCVQPDNAYLVGHPELQAAVAARVGNSPTNPFGCFTGTVVTKDFVDLIDQNVTTDTKVTRAVVGFNGAITGSWTWDAYYQYGEAERDQIGHDYRTNHRYDMAVDAIIDPRPGLPTTGQPVCRATVFGPPPGFDPSLANGCQPLNLFGASTASPEAIAYAFGNLTESNTIKQNDVAGSVTGELWGGWGAGALAGATGLEYRKEELENLAGDLPFAQRTDFGAQYGDAFAGEVQVTEGFVELEMPLLRDVTAAQLLQLNGAVRQAHYKNTGGLGTTGQTGTHDITTWKLAAVWEPLQWLRMRGSQSRDLRAAGFRELYYSQSIPAGGFFGATTNPSLPDTGFMSQRDETVIILSGNPRLSPEKAETTTFGFVLSPGGWADGMHFSADYYRIDLADGLALGSSADVVRECFDGSNPSQCDFITFGPPDPRFPGNARSNITELRAPYINALPYKATGVDFALDYLMPLNRIAQSTAGSLSFRLTATRALETIVQSAGIIRDIAGQTGGDQGFLSDFAASPDLAANLVVTYLNGPFQLTAQGRYTSKGDLDRQTPKIGPGDPGYAPDQTTTVTDSTLPSHFTMNLSTSYQLPWGDLKNLEVFGTVDNVFDRDPPWSAGQVGGTNALYFDTLGRRYRLGMRAQF